MKFSPQRYRISDRPHVPFIDPGEIMEYLRDADTSPGRVRDIIGRALSKERLTLPETAALLQVTDPELVAEILEGARQLKRQVYGNRIVLFAPLYIGNLCQNNCTYCGFRVGNRAQLRHTLSDEELVDQVRALEGEGQKRLILVYGEHPSYTPEFIARTVGLTYATHLGPGEIRRVNINAAPLTTEGFATVKAAGIGTYQIFQETYHPDAYAHYHPFGPKADFNRRLTSLDRAQDAGIDDVGIGALFGLYDWRYEALSLVRHTNHLEACYNVGPHTISFPRIQEASAGIAPARYVLADEDFLRLVAVLRLAVPYTGLILTAREPAHVRDRVIEYGISQIDGGTRLEIGAYAKPREVVGQALEREQFRINDDRTLAEIIQELIARDHLPSFCTACYRLGRTGEHFMEFSVPGFIKRYCTPNALLTLAEYLEDYADPELRIRGNALIERTLASMDEGKFRIEVQERIARIRAGERDLYF